jgi:peptidoglycan L-alanyl-D-glutamate endopeptidase CwlK
MASRKLSDLHPELFPIAEKFLDNCHTAGIDILVTCTHRSYKEQDELYAISRTIPGKKVTNAKAGQSKHNFMLNGKPASKAFDVVPLVNGKAVWDASNPIWQKIGVIGESLGLSWAGRWKSSMREYPHFELKE